MKKMNMRKIFASIAIGVVTLGCGAVMAKPGVPFPEQMKSAIAEFEKARNKGAQSTFDVSQTANNRTILTVSPQAVKGQPPSAGYKVMFYDCGPGQTMCQSIRFETSRPATTAANICGEHWTNSFRFGRVRTDDAGALSLDMTQLIYANTKAEDLRFTVGIWSAIVGDFEKLLVYGNKCNPLIKPVPQEAPVTTFGN